VEMAMYKGFSFCGGLLLQHFKEFVCNKIMHQGKCKPLLADTPYVYGS
jgi:hypothetical protein